jgi:hypothetical protein
MPWHQKAMKDVVTCDKLRVAGKQAVIRRSLNGETLLDKIKELLFEYIE